MGPSRTPRRTKGQNEHWENIGVRGRKTGVTLKAGVRDENGLESIDGIFSSPEKSPAKSNGLNQISTISEGESMDIGQSTNLDPTEVIDRARNGRNFLPPRSRSPIKTNIGSSPRRSLGPTSSPSRVFNGATPNRSMSHPPESSNLDISREDLTPSIEGSGMKGRILDTKNVKKLPLIGKGKKRAFDLSMASDSDDDRASSIINGANETNGDGFNDSALLGNGDDSLVDNGDKAPQIPPEDSIQIEEQDVPVGGLEVEITEVIPAVTAPVKRRPGRPPKAAPIDTGASQNALSEQKEVSERPSKKTKKDVQSEVQSEENVEQGESSGPAPAVDEGEQKVPRKRGRPKKQSSGPDSNAETKPPRPTVKPSLTKPKDTKTEGGKPKLTSLFAVRSQTPGDDNGALVMKSGRTSIKPLAFWRNERVVLGDGNIEGEVLTLPSIKEVIRTDEIEIPRSKRYYRRSKPRRQIKEETEEEDERAPWEIGTGTMRAQVMQWDPAIGKYDEENSEETDIAYAAEAIEMRDISGAEFRFAKTLTLPFFGSGMVELPPEGAKRVKNSRKMQMVFFVFYGRVTVDVGTPTTSFSIGKGGMWQVPRGNFYSITNHSTENSARIFFAQGCEVNPETVFDESAAA